MFLCKQLKKNDNFKSFSNISLGKGQGTYLHGTLRREGQGTYLHGTLKRVGRWKKHM